MLERVPICHELHGMFLHVMSNVTEISRNLCNKCPKWLVKQNSSQSDYFNAISGFTLNNRAPGGPVTVTVKANFAMVLKHGGVEHG